MEEFFSFYYNEQSYLEAYFLCAGCRYLSSGMRIPDVAVAFRVGIETARQAIHLTCLVIWEELSPIYMKV